MVKRVTSPDTSSITQVVYLVKCPQGSEHLNAWPMNRVNKTHIADSTCPAVVHVHIRVMTGIYQNGCHEHFILVIQFQ